MSNFKKSIINSIVVLLSLGFVFSCDYSMESLESANLYKQDASAGSTLAGNLIATAIKEENNVDIVLYPSEFLQNRSAKVRSNMTDSEISTEIYPLYDSSDGDTFMVGYLSGESIVNLIKDRFIFSGSANFQVAGIKYEIITEGGIINSFAIAMEDGSEFDETKKYKIAIDKYNYSKFPGYLYLNGFNFDYVSLY